MNQITASGGTINIIHFMTEIAVPPLNEDGPPVAQYRIVCMPNMTEFHQTPYHPNYQRTNDPRAASCPACKKTAAYTKAMDAIARAK